MRGATLAEAGIYCASTGPTAAVAPPLLSWMLASVVLLGTALTGATALGFSLFGL